MDTVFTWIESTGLSTWLRDSPSLWAFPFVLILHTAGLAFLVGTNVAVDVRTLGFVRTVPPRALERYFLIMWIGFWVNAASGILLLIAYPTKALTNPLFYVKLALIAVGLTLTRPLRRHLHAWTPIEGPGLSRAPLRIRAIAVISLVCWAASITAGRLLAYTYTRLTVDFTP